jgi:hypothetical protein
MFLNCPAWLDHDGTVRCGLPAEVRRRYILRSTDRALKSTMIRCPAGHWFNGPIESLIREAATSIRRALPEPLPVPRGDSLTSPHDGRRNGGRRPDHPIDNLFHLPPSQPIDSRADLTNDHVPGPGMVTRTGRRQHTPPTWKGDHQPRRGKRRILQSGQPHRDRNRASGRPERRLFARLPSGYRSRSAIGSDGVQTYKVAAGHRVDGYLGHRCMLPGPAAPVARRIPATSRRIRAGPSPASPDARPTGRPCSRGSPTSARRSAGRSRTVTRPGPNGAGRAPAPTGRPLRCAG